MAVLRGIEKGTLSAVLAAPQKGGIHLQNRGIGGSRGVFQVGLSAPSGKSRLIHPVIPYPLIILLRKKREIIKSVNVIQ